MRDQRDLWHLRYLEWSTWADRLFEKRRAARAGMPDGTQGLTDKQKREVIEELLGWWTK